MSEIRVGLVGYKFMGKAHSHAFHDMALFFPDAPTPVKQVICGRDEDGLSDAKRQFGWHESETDWLRLVERDDIDVIDVTAPSDGHKEIVIAAAENGKHVFCEKPLALTLTDAKEMLAAVSKAGVKHMVGFNYRYVPAVQLAKSLIESGRIGKVYHYRAWFLQDWIVDPDFPLVWRLQKDIAGSGAHGDLGAHIIDLARFLIGDFQEVVGMSDTFIKRRPIAGAMTGLTATGAPSGEYGDVTVDDATAFLARFRNGAMGTFEATRFAPGHRCTNAFEINGSLGSIRFDFERMNELEVYFREDNGDVQGFRRISVTEAVHPYGTRWWPPGHTIGFEHSFIHEMVEFLSAVRDNRAATPSFLDGVRCQEVLECVDQSIEQRQWVSVSAE